MGHIYHPILWLLIIQRVTQFDMMKLHNRKKKHDSSQMVTMKPLFICYNNSYYKISTFCWRKYLNSFQCTFCTVIHRRYLTLEGKYLFANLSQLITVEIGTVSLDYKPQQTEIWASHLVYEFCNQLREHESCPIWPLPAGFGWLWYCVWNRAPFVHGSILHEVLWFWKGITLPVSHSTNAPLLLWLIILSK